MLNVSLCDVAFEMPPVRDPFTFTLSAWSIFDYVKYASGLHLFLLLTNLPGWVSAIVCDTSGRQTLVFFAMSTDLTPHLFARRCLLHCLSFGDSHTIMDWAICYIFNRAVRRSQKLTSLKEYVSVRCDLCIYFEYNIVFFVGFSIVLQCFQFVLTAEML